MHETVYEERFGFTNALKQMGADIVVMRDCVGGTPCRFEGKGYGHSAIILAPPADRCRLLRFRTCAAASPTLLLL